MNAQLFPLRGLVDAKSDSGVRSVLDDWHREHGIPRTPLGVVLYGADVVVGGADDADDAAADDADDADDDAADDDDDVGAADDADDAADDDDVGADDADDADDAADDVDADDARGVHLFQFKDTDMLRNGIYVLRLRGGWYGRGIPVICWMRHVGGDWWHIVPGARTITRTNGDLTPIGVLATTGPTRNHKTRDPSLAVEIVNALGMIRIFEANEKAWALHCPRPVGWVEE